MQYQVMADNNEITKENVIKWINNFNSCILPTRIKLDQYYDGKNSIIKQGAVKGRPNYSINVNMSKYIVDVATGYTFGIPITFSTKDENTKTVLDTLQYINKNCNSAEIDFQQGGDMATYGVSYQLIMVKEGSEPIEDRIIYKWLNPLQTFYVVDNTVLQEPLCAIYSYSYNENNAVKTRVYVYDNENEYIYGGMQGNLTLEETVPHNMGYIPIIQSLNNDDAYGDFQQITDLLDSLSLAVSNNTDNLQSIANAFLAVSGGVLTKEHIELINQLKVAHLPEGSKMEWVVKNLNPQAEQQHIDNLLKFIFQISQVPDITDEAFAGNQSGVAMQFKLWGLDQLFATKTTKYKKTLFQRFKILLHLLQYQFKSNVAMLDNIDVAFTRNFPQDSSNEYQMVQALKDVVSDRTLLSNISIVEDVDKELEELDKQAEKNADLYGFNNNQNLENAEDGAEE